MDCVCTDPDLQWYPEKGVCARAKCDEGYVKEWHQNSLGEWEFDCQKSYGLSVDFQNNNLVNVCAERVENLTKSMNNCDISEAVEQISSIYSNCYDECFDIPTAATIGKALFINTISPEIGSSDSHIKKMVLINESGELTELNKAFSWYKHLESLDWSDVDFDLPYTVHAEVLYQQAVLHIRLAEILIKEKLTKREEREFSEYTYQKDFNNPNGDGGHFTRPNSHILDSWIKIALNNIEKYDSIKELARGYESYIPKSLDDDKEFLNAIREEL